MEEAASQDGRKRRLTFEPASERGSDKRHRTCCHGEDCDLTTKVSAQESTIRNLAGVVEDLLGRLAALEQPPSAISIDHTRTESSKRQSCPAENCSKAFDRTDHLHRHIRGVYDEPHLSLTRVLDQKYCVLCKKDFKRPCDLVRHEKSFHDETYISRAYKFATHPIGFARAPTPPDTSSNASTDWDDPASESEQEDIEVSETTNTYLCTAQNGSKISSDVPQNINFATDRPLDGCNQIGLLLPTVPTLSSDFFELTPFDSQGCSYLDNDSSNQAGLTRGFVPFFDGVPEDLSLIFTQELW
ncbi:hypothetical protein DL95DRAFT_397875 [Leptodontidium sp. 2 PMI_412]|nr:hypothetical protein DL95DRAFT_397875 [Leptodontidium sp. 2 PMI_412]